MAADDVLPTRSPDLVIVEVDGSRVVYDPLRRQAHLLNLTAGLVLDACDGATTVGELCDELATAFDLAEGAAIAPDVEAAVSDCWARGLLTDSPVREPLDTAPVEPLTRTATPVIRSRRWRWKPLPLDLLGTAVRIRVEDPELAWVAWTVLAPLIDTATTSRPPTVRLDLVTDGGETSVRRNDHELVRTDEPGLALQHLLWELNQLAVDGVVDAVLLHAAAVRGPAGIAVFPADSESGKSTLAAGLVRAGLDHLTDEAIGIDVATGAIRVYPRAIGLGPGSWPLFPEAAPGPRLTRAGYFAQEWHVDPRVLRPAALDGLPDVADAPVVFVAFPTYDPAEATRVEPAERAPALLALLHNAFNLAEVGEAGVVALDRLTRGADMVRLISSDLDEAVALIAARLGASTVPRR